jgi:hypothetical protein
MILLKIYSPDILWGIIAINDNDKNNNNEYGD